MKGYRVAPLTQSGAIRDEVGEIRYFSSTLERAEWWAVRLPQEMDYSPGAVDICLYGYVIIEIEAIEVKEDRFFPAGEDFVGLIVSARPVRVVRQGFLVKRQSLWSKILRSILP